MATSYIEKTNQLHPLGDGADLFIQADNTSRIAYHTTAICHA